MYVYLLLDTGLRKRHECIFHGCEKLLGQILVSEEMLPRNIEGDRVPPLVESIINYVDHMPSVTDNPLLRIDKVPRTTPW